MDKFNRQTASGLQSQHSFLYGGGGGGNSRARISEDVYAEGFSHARICFPKLETTFSLLIIWQIIIYYLLCFSIKACTGSRALRSLTLVRVSLSWVGLLGLGWMDKVQTLMLFESVRNIVSLSTPKPHPAVGGRPNSRAVQKFSSTNMASSSPADLS